MQLSREVRNRTWSPSTFLPWHGTCSKNILLKVTSIIIVKTISNHMPFVRMVYSSIGFKSFFINIGKGNYEQKKTLKLYL